MTFLSLKCLESWHWSECLTSWNYVKKFHLELLGKLRFCWNCCFLEREVFCSSEHAWVFLSKFLWLVSLLAVEYGGGCAGECQGCSHPSNFSTVSGDSPAVVFLSSTSMATTSSSTVMDLVRGRYLSGYPIKVRRQGLFENRIFVDRNMESFRFKSV